MTRLFLALAFTALASAQIHVTVSQQGAEVLRAVSGRKIPAIGVASVDVCNDGDAIRMLPPQRIYQAVQSTGVSTISPSLAIPLLDRQKGRSLAALTADGMVGAVGITGAISTTRVFKIGSGWTLGMTLAPFVYDFIKARANRASGNDSSTRANLLSGGDIGIEARGCIDRLILYRYRDNWEPRAVTIP